MHAFVTDLLAALCEVWIALLRPAFCLDLDYNGRQRWISNTPHVRQCLGTMTAEVLAASFIAKTPARKIISDCQSLAGLFLAVAAYVHKVTNQKEALHMLQVESWCSRLWRFASPQELCMNLQRLIDLVPHLVPSAKAQTCSA